MKEEEKEIQDEKTQETVEENREASGEPASKDMVSVSRKDFQVMLDRLKELEEMKDNLLRSAADFDNAKKRLARERDEFVKFGQEKFIRNLLPVLDNFERALAHADMPEQDSEEKRQYGNVISGIRMVQKQLLDILKDQGMTRVEALGKTFDPHQHEALAYVEEEGEADQVIEEIQAGYRLHDRLLRAAKVRVRHVPEPPKEPAGE